MEVNYGGTVYKLEKRRQHDFPNYLTVYKDTEEHTHINIPSVFADMHQQNLQGIH